jgi:hypothetical protein
MTTYKDIRGTAPLMLNLDSRWCWVATPMPIHAWRPLVPAALETGWAPNTKTKYTLENKSLLALWGNGPQPSHYTNYRIFRPIAHALSIQKRSEIVKNEHARYTLERFPTVTRELSVQKKVSENTVLCIKHNFQLKLVCLSIKMYNYLSSNWLEENDETHPSYLSGPMDTKKSWYSSPVDHRSLDDLCTSTYTMSQKLCVLYVRCVLSVLQKECRKVWISRYM